MDAVEVDGLRIAYRRQGSGDPLVILHGAFEDSRVWLDDMRRLSEHVDVIAWDAPGCGASDDIPAGWTSRDWGRVAASFIRALGLSRPAVAGLSFGSIVALLLARDHPERVGGLVLIGAYAGWAGSLDPDALEERFAQARFMIEHPVEEWADEFLVSVYSPTADPARRDRARRLLDDWRPETTRALLDVASLDLRSALPSISTPVVVVRGSDDVRSPHEAAVSLCDRLPDARLVELDGAGHDCAGPDLDDVLVTAAHTAANLELREGYR
ncbi:alpha/beta fold hydrolase [Gordonia rhizosphera]|uniref:Putative hydrolase n=1 Tax=Gordonia rhizosphera NBRC 16068 TaxID=1108045 RepID=K6WW16_9ACTN|nr:alpha/beta hydrolase [Gordonia rhizosphera]GAB90739.1 putative hydrolase [Gordonia rhizosphera NBRC 16068]